MLSYGVVAPVMWDTQPKAGVEVQFFRTDQVYPIAGPIPEFLGLRKLDFAHPAEMSRECTRHDSVLLGSLITISAHASHVPPQANAGPLDKERQLLVAYWGWEMVGRGVALPVITQKGWGRAGNAPNLPPLPTPVVFFLRPRLLLSERQGLTDSTKGRELAFPYKTGTALL